MTALIDLYKVDHAALVAWAVKTYGIVGDLSAQINNEHRLRRETIARRLRLYRDQATVDVERIIDLVYEKDDYKRTLKKLVPVALEQNVTKRIIDEIASLYDRPALRTFPDAATTKRFREEENRLRLHEIKQQEHRLLTLCNEILEWQFTGADGKHKLRLVTPDAFDAIPHPGDALVEAGLLIDMPPSTVCVGEAKAALPCYEIWDNTYRYRINAYGRMVDESGIMIAKPEEHGLGRIPGVLLHRREPTTCILDASHGADIESCHLGVALLNVMIMRLSKSQGERQPVLQGNLAAMAAGQTANGETPLLLPPEVTASMLDMKTSPEHYLAVKKDKISSTAVTHGMSYEQVTNSETGDSGKLYELRRERLKEIRNESRRRAVIHEAQTAKLIGFDPAGMRMDYQEQSLPQDAMEKVALMREKSKMGLDSPVKFVQRENPDLSRDEAIAEILSNQRDYALVIEMVRELNMPADADVENPGQSPRENGAMGGPADKSTDSTSTEPVVYVKKSTG